MKNRWMVFIFSVVTHFCFAQNPTYQQKLFYACKVWGFVKYYHSEVSTCQVNWDSVLIADLPLVKNAITKDDFNDALDTILNAAGPMQIASTVLPDTIAPELKRNRDWSWISDTMLRADVRVQLDTIKNNFRPHPICWVHDNDYTTSYIGWLVFPNDDTLLNVDANNNFPDEWNRLLMLFKYWNIIRYFNPYNYVLDQDWDSVLFQNAVGFTTCATPTELYFQFRRITSALNDVHAEGYTTNNNILYTGNYSPKLIVKYIPGKYVVVKSGIIPIAVGDEIVSVAGLTTSQWEDSLRPYISVGDSSVFRRVVANYMMRGQFFDNLAIGTIDSLANSHSIACNYTDYIYSTWFTNYYPNDTLGNYVSRLWGCNVGYLNMKQLFPASVNSVFSTLQNTDDIIVDLRCYPNGTAGPLANLLFSQRVGFAKDMIPDVTYPGTYYWYLDSTGIVNNPNPYQGRLIILINAETQSQAEYSSMLFRSFPNSVLVGSQTAGADGNVSYFQVTQETRTGFSNLGIFYPNGDSTQRIGIVPDSLVYPTQAGIRHHRDEVLEKALEIAQCWLSVPEVHSSETSLSVFPNPTGNDLTIQAAQLNGNKATILVTDITGRVVQEFDQIITNGELMTSFDLSNFSSGIYFVQVKDDVATHSTKVVKE